MKNKVVVSTENLKISIESTDNDSENKSKKVDYEISIKQMISFVDIFKDICETVKYTDKEVEKLSKTLNYNLGWKTTMLLTSIGSIRCKDFNVPDKDGLIKLTKEWRSTVAKDNEKDKFIVIESDNGDYTLVDNDDIIYVYDHVKKETICYNENVITHITKHIMSKIVGDEYKY